MSADSPKRPAKRALWAVAPFYALVAFEFFYMASPFALYFYSVYRPGLGFLTAHPGISWLSFFFLPHIVPETSSRLLDASKAIGALLTVGGFLAFLIAAAQVYYSKLARKGVVTGGVYNWIRHPQYTALAISSLGMLILWPRLLVVPLFLAVLFVYYFLAKAEERECQRKFGSAYTDYMEETGMFLPFKPPELLGELLPTSRGGRFLTVPATFLVMVLISLVAAQLTRSWAAGQLYTYYSGDAAYISLSRLGSDDFENLVEIALSNAEVRSRLNHATLDRDTRFLNYVLPADWYISEIPMNPVGGGGGHYTPSVDDSAQHKIVFTRAKLRSKPRPAAKRIILDTLSRVPVVEVWVDLTNAKISRIAEPPREVWYPDVPVPTF